MKQPIPNCVDTERNVLGYCMLNAGYLDTCRADLEPDDFELPQHVTIWHAICRIYDAGGQVERLTVFADLLARGENNQIGGLGYLVSLDDALPLVPSIENYIRQLHDAKIRRRIVFAASHIAKMAQDTTSDLDTVVETFGKSLVEITSRNSGKGPMSTREMIETIGITELLKPREESGISLPWPRVQKALCGLQAGQMAVLMAATSRDLQAMVARGEFRACGSWETRVLGECAAIAAALGRQTSPSVLRPTRCCCCCCCCFERGDLVWLGPRPPSVVFRHHRIVVGVQLFAPRFPTLVASVIGVARRSVQVKAVRAVEIPMVATEVIDPCGLALRDSG